MSNIPDYKAPEYEELDTVQEAVANALGPIPPPPQLSRQPVSDSAVEAAYGQLELAHTPPQAISSHEPTASQQQQLSPSPQAESYSRIDRKSHSPRTSPKPSRPRRGDYEDIPDGPAEAYGKLDHTTPVGAHLPTVDGNYDILDDKQPSPVPAKKKPPPPKPAPYKPKLSSPSSSIDDVEDVYSEIKQDEPVNIHVGTPEEYNKLDRKGAGTSFKGRPSVPVPTPEGYGKLNRSASTSNPELAPSGEHYGALEHFPRSRTPGDTHSVYIPEEYGKLEHGHSGFDPYASLSLSESYRDGPGGPPVAVNLKQDGNDYADEPQLTSDEFYGQLNADLGRVNNPGYSTVELHPHVRKGISPAATSNGNPLLSPESSLPESEEIYDDTLNPPKSKFEALYEPTRTDNPLPPVPPRKGASVRKSPQLERKNGITVTPPNGSPPAPRTSNSPPKLKPKPKPKPRVHIL